MNTTLVASLVAVIATVALALGQDDASVVMYWGQNGAGNEQTLATVCDEPYEFIILGFLHIFFDPNNKDNMPGLNLANHCSDNYGTDYPDLLNCPEIAQQITQCQSKGKKVMLSLGGAAGLYGFTSDNQANGFANVIWDLVLGGRNDSVPRPFHDATLDGVDLDIEGGTTTGYASFVSTLRSRMSEDKDHTYYISGAPQCPYPDAYLGPEGDSALEKFGEKFDFISIQFYNNYCAYLPSDPTYFKNVWKKWSDWTQELNNGPKLYVGLLAQASGNGYVLRDDLSALFKEVISDSCFGGGMVWDASWSEKNTDVDGITSYGESVYKAIKDLKK